MAGVERTGEQNKLSPNNAGVILCDLHTEREITGSLRVHTERKHKKDYYVIAMLLLCDSVQIHLPLYSLTVGVFADILQK